MKRILRPLAILLILIMAFSLCACGNSATEPTPAATDEQAAYTAGTYTASAEGKNGPVEVEVAFTKDLIEKVTIVSHKETEGIADPALTRIPEEIVENQALGLDAVSGATYTSNAILAAVADCVTQAGGDAEALQAIKITSTAGEAIEKTADVIVVGAGGAGISASVSAAEQGASVILIEKTAAVGGNTLASGLAWNAADPEGQSGMDSMSGQADTLRAVLDYDETDFAGLEDVLATLKSQITDYLAGDTSKLFDSVEWHIVQTYYNGIRTDLDGNVIAGDPELVKTLCENSLDSFNWLSEVTGLPKSDIVTSPVGSMWMRGHNYSSKPEVFSYATDYITAHNGEIMLETKAVSLIQEDGRVTGVECTMTDGTAVTLHANDAVVITTGGFSANGDMVREYNTYWPAIPDGIMTTCVSSVTGDGIDLCKDVGANLVDMGMVQLMPTAGYFTGALTDGLLVAPQNYVFVNKEGVRFINEYAARDTLAFAALAQTDGMFYTIEDQPMAGTVQNHATQEDIDLMVEKGLIYKADTLEELAEYIGCDPQTLVDTIDAYNACVDNGSDPEFGKNVFEMKVETAPFYACPMRPAVHHTMGGVQIDIGGHVLDADGNIIPGLYAAGEVTGGIHGGNRLGGNAIADAFTFGRIAGRNAATGA